MNKDLYNKRFLKLTLLILKDNIHDLEMWSVYNEDKGSKEITELKKQVEGLEKKLYEK